MFCKNKIIVLLFIFTLLFIVTNNILLTISHEQAHVAIDKVFNCSDIKTDYNYFIFNAITSANCNLSYQENIEYNKLHMFNEIISYNLKNISNVIIFGFFLVSFVLVNKSN